MRQLAPATNLVLAALAAFGLLGTLRLPWYAPVDEDPSQYSGPLEHAAYRYSGVFREHGGSVTGTDAIGDDRLLFVALVLLVVLFSTLMAVPALRFYAREGLRFSAMGLPAAALYRLLERPDGLEIHWGLLVAIATAVFAASAAWHGAAIRLRRANPGGWERRAVR
jgi:hypothetical protein